MKDHIKIIGILWVILGAFYICLAFFAFLVFFGVAIIPNLDIEPGVLRLIGIIASSFLGLIGLPQIIGGLGLIQHKEWARILMLVVSFLSPSGRPSASTRWSSCSIPGPSACSRRARRARRRPPRRRADPEPDGFRPYFLIDGSGLRPTFL
jgi:hypothetical protein